MNIISHLFSQGDVNDLQQENMYCQWNRKKVRDIKQFIE